MTRQNVDVTNKNKGDFHDHLGKQTVSQNKTVGVGVVLRLKPTITIIINHRRRHKLKNKDNGIITSFYDHECSFFWFVAQE